MLSTLHLCGWGGKYFARWNPRCHSVQPKYACWNTVKSKTRSYSMPRRYQNTILFLTCSIFFMSVCYTGQEGVIVLNNSHCLLVWDWPESAGSLISISNFRGKKPSYWSLDQMEMQDQAHCRWAELFYVFELEIILYCKNFVSYIQQRGSQHCFVLTLVFIHIWVSMLNLVAKHSLSDIIKCLFFSCYCQIFFRWLVFLTLVLNQQ